MIAFLNTIIKSFIYRVGSDHPIHVRVIKMIKQNGYKYSIKDVFTFDEYATYYPFLYHWILSCFFYKTAINKPHFIQWAINFLKLISFNVFLYSLSFHYFFNDYDYFILNFVYLTFPFSYSFWNAKNTGLSARGLGLLLGQIYVYGLYHYLLYNSEFTYVFLITISFLVILSSMMAFQFIVLSAPLLSLIFYKAEVITIPIISYFIFFILFNKQAKKHFVGVLNYYKNYSNYYAEIFIFKYRPNIYRDFIKDFWAKFSDQKIKLVDKIKYIFLNPLIELIHGFPYLIIFLFFIKGEYGLIEVKIIGSILFLFFLITLNPFRFLGEPQRYIEFIIPIITIIFVVKTTPELQLFMPIVLFIFIRLISILKGKREAKELDVQPILNHLDKNFNFQDILISNDQNFLKFCAPILNIITTDTSKYIESTEELHFFNKYHYGCLTPESLIYFSEKYQPKVLVLNLGMYSDEETDQVLTKIKCNKIIEYKSYFLFKI